MFNKAILMGRICHDLELKTTPNGVSVLSFRIAVDRNYQVKGEERKADFFNVVTWRSTAEFVAKYFGKGRMIMVDGELQTRQYVDKNNITQNIVEIVADTIHFTGERPPQQQGFNPGGGNGNYGGNGNFGGNGNYGGGQSGGGYNGGYGGGYGNGEQSRPHPAETANIAPAPITGGLNADFAGSGNDEDDYPF